MYLTQTNICTTIIHSCGGKYMKNIKLTSINKNLKKFGKVALCVGAIASITGCKATDEFWNNMYSTISDLYVVDIDHDKKIAYEWDGKVYEVGTDQVLCELEEGSYVLPSGDYVISNPLKQTGYPLDSLIPIDERRDFQAKYFNREGVQVLDKKIDEMEHEYHSAVTSYPSERAIYRIDSKENRLTLFEKQINHSETGWIDTPEYYVGYPILANRLDKDSVQSTFKMVGFFDVENGENVWFNDPKVDYFYQDFDTLFKLESLPVKEQYTKEDIYNYCLKLFNTNEEYYKEQGVWDQRKIPFAEEFEKNKVK